MFVDELTGPVRYFVVAERFVVVHPINSSLCTINWCLNLYATVRQLLGR